jgi:hypothetical protein
MYVSVGLHVKYPLLLLDFKEVWMFSTDLENYSKIKFHKSLSTGGPDRENWRIDMMKLIVAFNISANAPKNAALLDDAARGTLMPVGFKYVRNMHAI